MTSTMGTPPQKWWQKGVIYQIYPLTFADGNGDGVGDLQGIIQRLDYLNDGDPNITADLEIDAIWLSPIYKSPMVDNGYDISDYYDICSTFGTLADFKELLEQCHIRGIRVIMDLVLNHTSNQHPWFLESSASRENPKSDWYLWQDPGYKDGLPNNWLSYFGGTGWTFNEQRQQYYFHVFNENQPDLNWRNPEVKQALHDMIRYWLEMGVDGFRLDASSVYSKDQYYRDNPVKFGATNKNAYHNQEHLYDKDLPDNHVIIREIRSLVDKYEDRVLIGETFIDSRLYDSNMFYGINNDELHLPFAFEFPFSPWYPGYLQREIEKKERITPVGAWPTYFLDNHDIPRHLSRWIECALCTNPTEIAKAAGTLLLTLRGTPVLYYGQEIGMEDHQDIPKEQQRDQAVVATPTGELPPNRDGSRTPMQWDGSAHSGFSFGQEITPWLPVHKNYKEVNVEVALKDKDSILNFYRKVLRVRRQSDALCQGTWRTLIHYPYEHLAYLRETEVEQVLILINFAYEKPLELDVPIVQESWQVLASNLWESGKVLTLPETLQSFEIDILKQVS